MQIVRKIEKTEYCLQGTMDFPLFDCEIDVEFDEDINREYVEKCADYLQHLPENIVERLCRYTQRYCEEFRKFFEEVGDECPVPRGIEAIKILKYITPTSLIVNKPDDENVIGFHVGLNCDWEEEHALEWTIKDGKVRYVGSFDDMSAWNEGSLEYVGFYNENEDINMNYVDKE